MRSTPTIYSRLYKAGTGALGVLYPFLKHYAKNRPSARQRLGDYTGLPLKSSGSKPRIWMHAASVGEVSVALTVYQEMIKRLPQSEVVVSTTTRTGQTVAKTIFPPETFPVLAPVDLPLAVEKALHFINPDILVFVETEIWPNWIAKAHVMGIPTVMVNGRISTRSFQKYLKIAPLMTDALKHFDCLSMISSENAHRIARMGGALEKIRINGNAKFDNLVRPDENRVIASIREKYSLHVDDRVFVAGSTRRNEGEMILKAYQSLLEKFPQTLLFIAPRHVERAETIAGTARKMGLDCQFRSEFDGKTKKRTAPVVIMDTIGELSAVYGISTVSFCGGSLVPLGGQNILEAVAWGKPVFYGPHMEDFQEARDLVEAAVGEAFLTANHEALAQKVIAVLNDPDHGKRLGEKAKAAILKNKGAAQKHARVIVDVLSRSKCI